MDNNQLTLDETIELENISKNAQNQKKKSDAPRPLTDENASYNPPIDKTAADNHRTLAIMAALDADQAFKLYSYRILAPEAFIEKMLDIANLITNGIQNGKK